MPDTWEVIGLVGQACFFSRFFVQWLISEKRKRSSAPHVFWWLSLCGSLMVGSLAVHSAEWILVPAFVVNASIYVRNLWLQRGGRSSRLGPIPAAVLGLCAATLLVIWGARQMEGTAGLAWGWIVVGVCGQAIWGTRFVVQWWFSEHRGRSVFPRIFWWLSLFGSILNLAYTSQLDSKVFLIGYLIAWFVPARNLMIEHKRRKRLLSA